MIPAPSRTTIEELYGLVDPRWEEEVVYIDDGPVLQVRLSGKRQNGQPFTSALGASLPTDAGIGVDDRDRSRRRVMAAIGLDALIDAAVHTRVAITLRGKTKLQPIARAELVAGMKSEPG